MKDANPMTDDHEIPTALADALSIVEGFRLRQQVCALYLGMSQGAFAKEELRDLTKVTAAYNSPNFTRNMRSDKDLFDGSPKEGWTLTPEGFARAQEVFVGAFVPQAAAPVKVPTLAEEVEAALSGNHPADLEGTPVEDGLPVIHLDIETTDLSGMNAPMPPVFPSAPIGSVQPFSEIHDEEVITLDPSDMSPGEVIEEMSKKVSAALGVPKKLLIDAPQIPSFHGGIDLALGGGLPMGKITTFASPTIPYYGPDNLPAAGAETDYETADGEVVCGEVVSPGGIPAYPPSYGSTVASQALEDQMNAMAEVQDALATPALPAPPVMPEGEALAALQATYQNKAKPAFRPPPHEKRAPAMFAALCEKLGL